MKRPEVPEEILVEALNQFKRALLKRIRKHGKGAYFSRHETYGIIAEEFNLELLKAMQENNHINFEEELLDVAVAAIFGLASHRVIYDRKTGKRK